MENGVFRVLKKKPGKSIESVKVEATYLSDVGEALLGRKVTIERIPMNSEKTVWILIDEDGLGKDLPLNFLIPTISPYFPIQKIVGTAVFVCSKYSDIFAEEIYDYEVCDLSNQLERIAHLILSDDIQQSLSKNFTDYGKDAIIVQPL